MIGAFAYIFIGTIVAVGHRAIWLHRSYRLFDFADLLGFTLVMTLLAMPSAIVSTVSFQLIAALPRRYAALAFAASTLILLPILIVAFPWYMEALDTSNNWSRGRLLPATVYVSAAMLWIISHMRSSKSLRR